MGFRSVRKWVTLSDLERPSGCHYITHIGHNRAAFRANCIKFSLLLQHLISVLNSISCKQKCATVDRQTDVGNYVPSLAELNISIYHLFEFSLI